MTTIAAWRTAGLWTQLWHVAWSLLMRSWPASFPPRGFVGPGSGLFQAIDLRRCSIKSIRLTREASTHAARLWRLTYVWQTYLHPSRRSNSGRLLGPYGRRSAGAGVATSGRLLTTTTSKRSPSDKSGREDGLGSTIGMGGKGILSVLESLAAAPGGPPERSLDTVGGWWGGSRLPDDPERRVAQNPGAGPTP